MIFVGPISQNLGGSELVSTFAGEYMTVIFAGSIVFFFSFTLMSILQGEGDTKTPMKLSLLFTVVNIILDPIFIYTFGWGITGAALATVLAEVVALLAYFWYFFVGKKSYLRINPRELIYTPQIIKNILQVGFPAAMAQMGLSIAVLGVNFILAGFGDMAISAYGIGFRVDSLAILPILGLGAGIVPMVGFFRGAKDYKGAKKVYRVALRITLIITIAIAVLIFALASVLPGIFTTDQDAIRMTSEYLMIIAFAYPFLGISIALSSAFQGMGRGVPSLVITMARALLVAIPIAYFLAYYTNMGVTGVWIGLLASSVFSAVFSLIWIENYFRKVCSEC